MVVAATPKEKKAEKQKGPTGIAHSGIQLNYLLKDRQSTDFFQYITYSISAPALSDWSLKKKQTSFPVCF